jgi:hypothetical protein
VPAAYLKNGLLIHMPIPQPLFMYLILTVPFFKQD